MNTIYLTVCAAQICLRSFENIYEAHNSFHIANVLD
jgi:hypothetical protein